jgi:DNA-binding PadR family transcriptional regulator
VNPSILDVYLLSLIDRGLETPYDLLKQGGVSLGSSVPALRRLETADLVKKNAPTGFGKRPRHGFKLSTAGRKLARGAWISLLNGQPPSDFDSILRLVDVARHYEAKNADVVAFLGAASSERRSSARSGRNGFRETRAPLGIMATREAWDVSRLKAEAKFLAELAAPPGQKAPTARKRRLR